MGSLKIINKVLVDYIHEIIQVFYKISRDTRYLKKNRDYNIHCYFFNFMLLSRMGVIPFCPSTSLVFSSNMKASPRQLQFSHVPVEVID